VLDRKTQATGTSLVVTNLARHHQRIDADFNHTFVMFHGLQALNFNFVGFQAGTPRLGCRTIVRPCQVRSPAGVAGKDKLSTVRPNPSVETTPNRVAPWPGAGYKVHSPAPGQGATLSGSSHLKR
jgi:hypothetical protein